MNADAKVRKDLHDILSAIYDTVKETGDQGAPGGLIYAALMQIGISFEQYQLLMDTMVEKGHLRRSGDLYFAN